MKGISQDLLDLAYQKQWFKLFVKKEFGGAEASLKDGMNAMFEAASIDGSLGWCVNLGSGASYFSGFLTKEAAQEFLSDERSAFAGSGAVGRVSQQNGHYTILGRWPKCSGAAHATAFTVNGKLEDGSIRSFILRPEQVAITDSWTMMGLDQSSTYAIEAYDAKIPLHASFEIGVLNEKTAYSIHHIPFAPFARSCMIASIFGMVECFLTELRKDAVLNSIPALMDEVKKVEGYTERQFERFCAHAAELEGLTDSTEIEQLSNQIASEISYAMLGLNLDLMRLFRHGGLYLADLKTPANKAFRDVLVAGQHPLFR
jgi:indole-3-acetate monooxygenase